MRGKTSPGSSLPIESRSVAKTFSISLFQLITSHFDLVVCWGVLMHIPGAGRAIAELVRVTKHGGYLVLEEIKQNSPGARLMRLLWRQLKRKKITITKTPSGYKHTSVCAGETLFWRHAIPR